VNAPGRAGPNGGSGTEPGAVSSVSEEGAGISLPEPPPTTQLELASASGPLLSRAVAVDGAGQDQEWLEAITRLPATSALLRVERGVRGARFLLNTDRTTVGRHLRSDIFLDHATVSRSHAVFERRGTEFWVHDHGSLNGTYVNGERIETARLQTGARIQIGKFSMVFYQNLPAQLPDQNLTAQVSAPPGPPPRHPDDRVGPYEAHGNATSAGPGGTPERQGGGWWSASTTRVQSWLAARRRGGTR
jgi:pSer/pThr/pTyr-binding forkhead associated (FHA) protein